MRRQLTVFVVLGALLASGCGGAKGSDKADTSSSSDGTTATTAGGSDSSAPDGGAGKFGSIESPCGPGDAKVKADQAGASADKLYIGVANDRTSIRNGLLKELFDGATGFAKWCNEQGGVAGLPVEVVDMDGKLFEIEAAMAKACTGVFAMVGGGYAQDNLIFTGKDGSDFHKCGMVAVPGFAVSTEFAEASDQIQAIPNPPHLKGVSHFEGLKSVYPDKIAKYGVAFGDLPSIVQNKDQTVATVKAVEGYGDPVEISYDPINQDFAVTAQQVIDKGLELVSYIGEPSGLSKFSQALKDQGWDGVITADANQYDSRLLAASGPAAVEGVTVRSNMHPFEEADEWPATKQFMEIMDANVDGWEHAVLAIQAFSSTLLFATLAKQCSEDGEITRECIMEKGLEVHDWDGGGLHSSGDPGANTPGSCSMIVHVENGTWTRLYPEVGSDDDDGDGFHCGDVVEVTGNFGEGNQESSVLGTWPVKTS